MKGRLLPTPQKHLYRLLPLVFVQKGLPKPQGIASRSPRATGISIGMRGRAGIKTCNAIRRYKRQLTCNAVGALHAAGPLRRYALAASKARSFRLCTLYRSFRIA